jgi:hypothetical protein
VKIGFVYLFLQVCCGHFDSHLHQQDFPVEVDCRGTIADTADMVESSAVDERRHRTN